MLAQLWAKIERLQHWHGGYTNRGWLQPLKLTRLTLIFMVLSVLVAAGMNSYLRSWQYNVWEQNSQIFYLDDGTPLFTTTDASYFLGLAQAIKRDGDFQQFNELRAYSGAEKRAQTEQPASYLRDAPLLSVVLSIMASDSSPKALLEAGHRLIPFTAFLTALMVVFAFGAAGYWLEGSIAAAGGGLSLAYLQRSGAGRIDTDQLNLGFFYLMTGLVIFAARAKSSRASLVLAALAGTIFWIFDWWYSKPFFGWAFFVGFIWLSLVCRSDIKRVVLQSILFLSLSGLPFKGLGASLNSVYLIDFVNVDELIFPNTFDTITEIMQVPFADILMRISGSVWLGLLSVSGLGLWALRHPALAIVFGPAAAFALLNFVIGNRAIFYSAPMLWFGFGWLLITLCRWGEHKLRPPALRQGGVPLAMIAGFISVWLASPTSYVQAPTFDKKTVTNFQKLQTILPATDSAIASWWDYGYMSMLINNKPTLHDPGFQTTPSTYFIANNLLRRSQKQVADELQLLANAGYKGVIASRFGQQKIPPQKNTELYLVLTKDMTRWISSISKIGAFDIKTGKPYLFDGVQPGYQLRYDELTCQPTNSTHEFLCNGNKLNLVSGQIGKSMILDWMVISKDGHQTGRQKFPKANTPFVLHSEIGEKANRNMLIHRDLYFSVFHQLFYLNRAEPKYFTLVYDDFPDMRVFRLF